MTLPAMMRVVEISRSGGPEVLRIAERRVPQPGAREILVHVAAAGVNRPDILQRMGRYPVPPDASDLPGLEIAGRVAATGVAVTRWRVGDEVCALVNGGGYAEYCSAPDVQTLPVPKSLTLVQAASLPECCFTVYSNVFDRAGLNAGETLLVQGGSSGIGVTAIQMASAMGHRVFATAGTDEKCAACVRLGAERAFNYRTEDWAAETKTATGGRGVDVILDMVGGDYVPREIRCLADEGRLVIIAFLRGPKTELDLNELMRRRLTITGSTLRPRPIEFKGRVATALLDRVWPLFETSSMVPVVFQTLPLEEASRAHEIMESSRHIGKIVLTV